MACCCVSRWCAVVFCAGLFNVVAFGVCVLLCCVAFVLVDLSAWVCECYVDCCV